jgi:hypothetical protein
MDFIGIIPDVHYYVEPPPAVIDFDGIIPDVHYYVEPPPAVMDFIGIPARLFFSVPEYIPKKTIYICTLTGAPDGEEDITLPISSLSIRLRDGEPTYCGVVVPNVDEYGAEVIARPNGEIVIQRGYEYNDGGQSLSEICRVDLEDIAYDQGPSNSSIQIAGHKTETNSTPETIDIRPLQMLSLQSGGILRARAQTSFFLRPGDDVIYGDAGETFTAGLITISVGSHLDQMEVTEAEPT